MGAQKIDESKVKTPPTSCNEKPTITINQLLTIPITFLMILMEFFDFPSNHKFNSNQTGKRTSQGTHIAHSH